jgi:hypothetical protein
MEDNLEREQLLRDLYFAFAKSPRPEWIHSIMKLTGGLSMVEFIDACSNIEKLESMPPNLGAAIYRVAMERRRNNHLLNHDELKKEQPFDLDIAKGGDYKDCATRYLKLVSRSLGMRLKRDMFDSFWQTVNDLWGKNYKLAVDNGERWLNEMETK